MTDDDLRIALDLIDCDAEAGMLRWRARPRDMFDSDQSHRSWNARFAGKPVHQLRNPAGYLKTKVLNKRYYSHRLIWAMHNGRWPQGEVRHSNKIKADNRIDNLVDSTKSENMRNADMRRDNKTGIRGVYIFGRDDSWMASIKVGGKAQHLGTFKSKNAAVAARRAAELKHGFPNTTVESRYSQ